MALHDPLMGHLQRTLSSLPSPLAQLIYLASLRDAYTGRYLHEGWFSMATPEEVNSAARHMHSETFRRVVVLGLGTLCREIKSHLESVRGPIRQMAEAWLEMEPYREMVPRGASPVERRLFISQMRAALGVLVRSPDLELLGEPAASRPRRPGPPLPPHRDN